jgi:4a-hydroxytetrahydrobiopterin dehydratase
VRTPLDAAALAAALAGLPAWSEQGRRLVRTVRPAVGPDVLAEVARVADALDHHPVVEPVEGGTRFVVWTHVRDAVTEQDVALAHRLDALLDG